MNQNKQDIKYESIKCDELVKERRKTLSDRKTKTKTNAQLEKHHRTILREYVEFVMFE